MSPGRWRPKTWPTRRTEPTEGAGCSVISSQEILKDLYPDGVRRPWWAKLAKERGWMSAEEYYDVPQTEPVPRHKNPLVDLWDNEMGGMARRFFGGLILAGAELEP